VCEGIKIVTQPVSETKALAQKLEDLEVAQALEKDHLVNMNKNMDAKFSAMENMLKAFIIQSGASSSAHKHGKSAEHVRCFFCGGEDHFQGDCEECKRLIRSGHLKINPEGKL